MAKNEIVKDTMLTTFDNPFNPFKDFEAWWKEDIRLGHDCCGILAEEANINDVSGDEVKEIEIDRAMNEIVKRFPFIYRIVTPQNYQKSH